MYGSTALVVWKALVRHTEMIASHCSPCHRPSPFCTRSGRDAAWTARTHFDSCSTECDPSGCHKKHRSTGQAYSGIQSRGNCRPLQRQWQQNLWTLLRRKASVEPPDSLRGCNGGCARERILYLVLGKLMHRGHELNARVCLPGCRCPRIGRASSPSCPCPRHGPHEQQCGCWTGQSICVPCMHLGQPWAPLKTFRTTAC